MNTSNESQIISECLRFNGFDESKKKYILTMKLIHEKLSIEAYSESDIPDKYYKIEKSYEELIQNKFLTIYENINEIYVAFYNFILYKNLYRNIQEY